MLLKAPKSAPIWHICYVLIYRIDLTSPKSLDHPPYYTVFVHCPILFLLQMFEDFSVEDLARAFFREFLIQNRFSKTYEAFENEDVRSKQKIPKASLIKHLCMEHLIGQNKKMDKPYKSLSEILIHYLKGKYLSRQKENQNDKFQLQSNKDKYETKMELTPEPQQIKEKLVTPSQPQPFLNKPTTDDSLPSRVTTMRRINKKDNKGPDNSEFKVQVPEQRPRTSANPVRRDSSIDKEEKQRTSDRMFFEFASNPSKPADQSIKLAQSAQIKQIKPNSLKQIETKPEDVNKEIQQNFKPVQKPLQAVSSQAPQSTGQPQKKMMMFGRRKQQTKQQPEQKEHKYFNKIIEDNEPLKVVYNYQKLNLNKMTPQTPLNSELSYKKPQAPMRAGKKKEKAISYDQGAKLRKILYQGQSKGLPKAWCQGLLLSPHENTFYGLEQLQGGPCGIVAALQCYYLKHLLYLCPTKNFNQQTRESCLMAAAAELLYKMNPNKVTIAVSSSIFSNQPVPPENIELYTFNVKNLEQVYDQIYQYKTNFIGKANHGYTLLLYSCVLTKGCEEIQLEMDSKESPLIGNHGHCNQQLVNLFITGKASTNCFDGVKELGDATDKVVLKGIQGKQQFGFLTIFESLGYIQVGKNLKNPSLPIWVICKQFHYHVIFGNHYLISMDNKTETFDIVYFDGLYNCKDYIVLTLSKPKSQDNQPKLKDLPMIQQVLLTKWGRRGVDWNGSIPIL